MAGRYPADSTGGNLDEGTDVVDTPVDRDRTNQQALGIQERSNAGASVSSMVSGREHSGGQKEEKVQCILKTPIGKAPLTADLKKKLAVLLDPPRDMGGDFRSLASAFGYNSNQIRYWTDRPNATPTKNLLDDENSVTIEDLLKKLRDIKREDAASEIEEYIDIRKQECMCDDCENSIR